MKKFIDYYTITIVRRHLIYIVIFLATIVLTFFVIPKLIAKIKDVGNKKKLVQTEITSLAKQETILANIGEDELNSYVNVADVMAPQGYDQFIIFEALADIERRSGLVFTSIGSPFQGINTNGAVLEIEAQGSKEAIMAFLQNYPTIIGRASLLESITFKPSAQTLNFTLHLLSKKTNLKGVPLSPLSEENRRLLQNLVAAGIGQEKSSTEEFSTLNKANPFIQ